MEEKNNKQDENKEKIEEKAEKLARVGEEKKIEEAKEEGKPEEKKEEKKEIAKKTEAYIKVENSKISTKHSMAICNYIRGKQIDEAISFLEEVKKKKKALPMKGELPYRKGGIKGRYPSNASLEFIKLLKSLRANTVYNGLDIDKTIIEEAIANIGNRPYKRFGSERSKRTHIYLKVKEIEEKKK